MLQFTLSASNECILYSTSIHKIMLHLSSQRCLRYASMHKPKKYLFLHPPLNAENNNKKPAPAVSFTSAPALRFNDFLHASVISFTPQRTQWRSQSRDCYFSI